MKNKKNTKKTKDTKKEKCCLFCFLATFFGVGKIKGCPGTWGSLATIPFWILVNFLLVCNIKIFALLWIVIISATFLIGLKASNIYLRKKSNGKTDPSEIVIDEVVGQLISLAMAMFYYSYVTNLSYPASALTNFNILTTALIVLVPFATFRYFDIFKPWIIGEIDKNMKGSLGVMMDDVVAGLFGGIATILVIFLFYILKIL